MPRYTFSFHFRDLSLDIDELKRVMGFGEGPLQPPFDDYLEEVLQFASSLTDLKASCFLTDTAEVDFSSGNIIACGQSFQIGKTLCKELKHSTQLLFFICSAGRSIVEKAAEKMQEGDPVLAYFYDATGSCLAEAVAVKMQSLMQTELEPGDKLTNRYSPGYCNWTVDEQHKLFALMQPDTAGVSLTASALMDPVKSVSGVIGVGKAVHFREYPCSLCALTDCVYRKTA